MTGLCRWRQSAAVRSGREASGGVGRLGASWCLPSTRGSRGRGGPRRKRGGCSLRRERHRLLFPWQGGGGRRLGGGGEGAGPNRATFMNAGNLPPGIPERDVEDAFVKVRNGFTVEIDSGCRCAVDCDCVRADLFSLARSFPRPLCSLASCAGGWWCRLLMCALGSIHCAAK